MKGIHTALAAGTFALAMSATSASAVVVSYAGHDYDVTSLYGTFKDMDDLLQSQVWWGNQEMARAFADLVGTSLGTPNRGGDAGPYFAFDVPETGEDFAVGWYIPSIAVRNVSANPQFVDANATYAVAERIGEVPLPAGGLLLVSGIAALAAASRRRKGQA